MIFLSFPVSFGNNHTRNHLLLFHTAFFLLHNHILPADCWTAKLLSTSGTLMCEPNPSNYFAKNVFLAFHLLCVLRDVPRDSAAVLFTHACYSSTHLFSGSGAGLRWNPRSVIRYWDESAPWSLLDKSSTILGPSVEVLNLLLIHKDSSMQDGNICTVCDACMLLFFGVVLQARGGAMSNSLTPILKKKFSIYCKLTICLLHLSADDSFPQTCTFHLTTGTIFPSHLVCFGVGRCSVE